MTTATKSKPKSRKQALKFLALPAVTTVRRRYWFRGHGASDSRLLVPKPDRIKEQKCCCLGFCHVQAGVPEETLNAVPYPGSVKGFVVKGLARVSDAGRKLSTPFSKKAAKINDDRHLTEPIREQRLTELFAENGKKIKFV